MVFIASKKYACETCIKGHRSSACKHTDRPLFEIKKKGRPVTQCEHCRELRKTKQVHVKCICELKPSIPAINVPPPPDHHHHEQQQQQHHQQSNPKKGTSKGTEGAAFPNGLPDSLALEAHPFDPHHHPSSSSSSLGGVTTNCCCQVGKSCACWTPRKSAPSSSSKPRRKTESALSTTVPIAPNPHRNINHGVTGSSGLDAPTTTAAPAASASAPSEALTSSSLPHPPSHHPHHQILARISELRPVLPRPTHGNSTTPTTATYPGASAAVGLGPLHIPSSGIAHGHVARHHETAFSPYGRAFLHHHPHPERATATAAATPAVEGAQRRFSCGSILSSLKPHLFDRALAHSIPVTHDSSASNNSSHPSTNTFPSSCGCGESCSCPACFQHNGAPSFVPTVNAYHTCTDPRGCHACLDYTILSLPPDTALSIPEFQPPPQQQQQQVEGEGGGEGIDEWLRQVQANVAMSDVPPATPIAPTHTTAAAAAVNPSGDENSMIKEEPCSVWERPCVICTSYFCSCETRGDCGNLSSTQPCNDDTSNNSNNDNNNNNNSSAEAAEMSDFAMYSASYSVDQGFGGDGGGSAGSAGSSQQMFDYTGYGFSDATATAPPPGDEAMFPLLYSAYGGGGGPMDIVNNNGKAQAPLQLLQQQQQQPNAVYINERGFYSDSFLNLLSSNSDEVMFPISGIPGGDAPQFPISEGVGVTYLSMVPPLSAGSTSSESESTSSSFYAMSNPALSDTESSSFDSVEDVSLVPPPLLSSRGYGNNARQDRVRGGRELSPESLDEFRTLY